MNRLTDEQIEAIRTAAKACPPGPYHNDGWRLHGPTEDEDKRNGTIFFEWKYSDEHYLAGQVGALACICDPETVLAMIAEIEAGRLPSQPEGKAPLFTQQHHDAIIEVLHVALEGASEERYNGMESLKEDLGVMFNEDNPKFDGHKFDDA